MRFLHTSTLQFAEVPDSEESLSQNTYAILSHRWGAKEDEVTFTDIESGPPPVHKKGYVKLQRFCDAASRQGFRYAWADTCCIDKRSSTELAEAIRSMYHWYGGAAFCAAYLEGAARERGDWLIDPWFERGWTLQELIAPRELTFFDNDWEVIGTKTELGAQLARRTGIPERILSHDARLTSCSVAQRMSWAAGRDTTRLEDRAYSLIGLFNVSLTPDYGEREKAFLRLQQVIALGSKDESLFAWDMPQGDKTRSYTGLYAPSPSCFADCSKVYDKRTSSGFTEANGELTIKLGTYPYRIESYFALLNCGEEGRAETEQRNAILLTRLPNEGEYVRVKNLQGISRMSLPKSKRDNLKQRPIRVPIDPMEPPLNILGGFWLRTLEPPDHEHFLPVLLSRGRSTDTDRACLGEYETGTAGVAHLRANNPSDRFGWSKIRWIKFGFDVEWNPVLLLANGVDQRHAVGRQVPLHRLNQRIFEKAAETGRESQEHLYIMDNSWIDGKAGMPHRSTGWPAGVSILEINRRTGFLGTVPALNLGVSVKLLPDYSPTQTTPVEEQDGSGLPLRPTKIWVVDLTNKGGNSPERDKHHADWVWCLQHFLTCNCGICGLICFQPYMNTKRAQRAAQQNWIGRLNAN